MPGVSDRRQTPRYEIKLSVEMVPENGNIIKATTRNISSCGLQIVCDRWVIEKIEPRGIQSHAVGHIRMKTVSELPIGNEKKELNANCRIMSFQRLSQNEYMLNLTFIDFEHGSEQILNKFLDQYQQKKTVIKKIAIDAIA